MTQRSNEHFLELANDLDGLIRQPQHDERGCRYFLRYINEELCAERPNRFLRVDGAEEPTRFGSSDYIVSAEISHGGTSERRAYVWELKAPQVYLYEKDDSQRRFRPTKELVKAETQLIHYVSDHQDSVAFRDYFGLSARSEVVAAGIIMGSRSRLVRISESQADETALDEHALVEYSYFVREHYIYYKAGIRLKTWDWVAHSLRRLAGEPHISLSGHSV